MIGTFEVITVHGTGDPQMLSGGISEALLTTQFGLMVAIPALFFHAILSSRVDHVLGDMETNSLRLLNLLHCTDSEAPVRKAALG
jgi:biopolymer transport protein ExbB